jgi:hypothetical protein
LCRNSFLQGRHRRSTGRPRRSHFLSRSLSIKGALPTPQLFPVSLPQPPHITQRRPNGATNKPTRQGTRRNMPGEEKGEEALDRRGASPISAGSRSLRARQAPQGRRRVQTWMDGTSVLKPRLRPLFRIGIIGIVIESRTNYAPELEVAMCLSTNMICENPILCDPTDKLQAAEITCHFLYKCHITGASARNAMSWQSGSGSSLVTLLETSCPFSCGIYRRSFRSERGLNQADFVRCLFAGRQWYSLG